MAASETKKSWEKLKKAIKETGLNSGHNFAMTLRESRGDAVITVGGTRDVVLSTDYQEDAVNITMLPEFENLNARSYRLVTEYNKYEAGWFYDVRIRIDF